MVSETLLYDCTDGLATITINRPERRNSATVRMLREMYELLGAIADDPKVRVLVLTGSGRDFCPGVDVKHVLDGGADRERAEDGPPDASIFRVPSLLREMPAVTIAAINGACAGAGLGWACACDLRVAAASAVFNTAFLERNATGDMSLPWTLSRIVGAGKARELSFLPGKFDAAEALRIGLVAAVHPDATFRDEVAALAQRLLSVAPVALRGLKANYVSAERMPLADYSDYETLRHQHLRDSGHFKDAFAGSGPGALRPGTSDEKGSGALDGDL